MRPSPSFSRRSATRPRNAEAHVNLGWVLNQKGRIDAAIQEFRQALDIDPYDPEALHNLGALLGQRGEARKAIELYREALKYKPKYPDAQRDLGLALAAEGKFEKALPLLRAAAAGYARAGRFPEAVATAEKALALVDPPQSPLAGDIRKELQRYRAGKSKP